ncbi:hypothetical protein [Flavobacterium sp. CAU 1735]|uniref:hypothetical protein n=1 Tax=Flavobacterium sp. CAU 1735 TaxID=3140361 RepID=UPI00325FE03F
MEFEEPAESLIKEILSRTISSLLPYFIGILPITLFIISIIDWNSNDDLTVSSKSALNEENVQYEIRKNETKFRDQLFHKLDSLYLDKGFAQIDSIAENSRESNEIKKYIILSKLKNDKVKYSFSIPVEKITSPVIELESITTTFYLDFDKLSSIIQSSKSELNEDSIKYGNYLKTKYDFNRRFRYDYIIIALFIIISFWIFFYFRNRIGNKDRHKVEDAIDNLSSDKDAIKLAQEILKDDKIDKKEIEQLKKLVNQIEANLNTYKFDNILDSILYVDLTKAERKSLELYNRSTLMLILGLLMAILGILVFYFTLPEFKGETNSVNYLSITIRPTLILLFIQSIAFYLLKQYRSLINDYKYFHEEYLNKSQTFITYQLMQNDNLSEVEMKLIDKLLSYKKEKTKTEDIEIEKIPQEKILDIFKSIIDKFK